MSTSKKNLDLSSLIPNKLRNETSVSLFQNLFNKFLSKDSSVPMLGWIGDNLPGSLYINQPNFKRKINSLEPILYTKHGAQEFVTSFNDILDKLTLLGVDTTQFAQWGAAQEFNFAPPISMDKFANFSSYRWVAKSLKHKVIPTYNANSVPEYVVIAWPETPDKIRMPVRVASTGNVNMLVGLQSIDNVQLNAGDRVLLKDQTDPIQNGIYVVNAYNTSVKIRVIINGDIDTSYQHALEAHVASQTTAIVDPVTGFITGINLPTDTGKWYIGTPTVSFIGGTSGGAQATVQLDANGSVAGFTVTNPGAAWVRADDFKTRNLLEIGGDDAVITTATNSFIAVVEGDINSDTFYTLTSINPTTDVDPITFAIFNGTVSDWTKSNYWVHKNDLQVLGIDVNLTTQAIRPIIEYDYDLELNGAIDAAGKPTSKDHELDIGVTTFVQQKTYLSQLPLFNLFTVDGSSTTVNGKSNGLVSSIFYYAEDSTQKIDGQINRRLARNASGDYQFEQGLLGPLDEMYFFKKGNLCSSIWSPGAVVAPTWVVQGQNGEEVVQPGGPAANPNGAWKIPDQMFFNLEHENRAVIGYADLRSHFVSVIKMQSGFLGSSFGKNNVRHLTVDNGLGGKIKDFNSAFNLFLSLINQKDISPLSIIDFAQSSYEASLNGALEFINVNLTELISSGTIKPTNGINPNDVNIQKLFTMYQADLIKSANSSETNNYYLTKIYGDSTSAIKNWPATLPYLGFAKTQPNVEFDNELGINVFVHHDGHKSPVILNDDDTIFRLVNVKILRSDAQLTAGTIAPVAPSRPYKNQLWYNTATKILYQFSVLSDAPIFVDAPGALAKINGDIWYNRSTGMVNVWNDTDPLNAGWFQHPEISVTSIFKPLNIANVYNSFVLALENKLYAGAPAASSTFDASVYANNAAREVELASFAAKHNLDPYAVDFNDAPNTFPADIYDVSDPFTWNYTDATFTGTVGGIIGHTPQIARWQNLYKKYFVTPNHPNGTCRPNLEPWVLTNESKSAFMTNWSSQFGSPSMWVYVKSVWNKPLCVDTATNRLLPPYVSNTSSFSADALTTVLPPNIKKAYKLGDEGPIELAWEKSIDYQYAMLRVGFKLDPVNFIGSTWGSKDVAVNEYEINTRVLKKLMQNDIKLHGEFDIDGETIVKFAGFAQTYTQLLRYNSIDTQSSINSSLLRDWTVELGYRVSGLLDTEILKLKSDNYSLHDSDFNCIINNSQYVKDAWLESLRIQVVKPGASITKSFGVYTPIADGSDWNFRIELYNYRHPQLSYYDVDTSGASTTFNALNKLSTDLPWLRYSGKLQLITKTMPLVITGIQNVINFIVGYEMKLIEDGWSFDQANDPQVDSQTGRIKGLQLEIEKYINTLYSGISPGKGIIINPFLDRVWMNTPIGVTSEFKGSKFIDLHSTPCALDVFGDIIPKDKFRVLRSDDVSEFISDIPMASVHSMLDAYEHIIVFQKYSADKVPSNLIYDPFLGLRVSRLYIDSKKQQIFDGKPTIDGNFIINNKVVDNLESSVSKMVNYYETDSVSSSSKLGTAAKALLGYTKKSYFENINATDNTQFNFWKGLIHNKGSNTSVDAYLNSIKFKSAKIDEFWAYKLATYGDARPKEFPEIKLNASDTRNRFTILQFEEPDENLPVQRDGSIIIKQNDETRWFTINDSDFSLYFEANLITTIVGDNGVVDQLITLPSRCDMISGAILVNSTTAKLSADGSYSIACYGPAAPKFSPAKLIDYRSKAMLADIPMWDPARGLHNPQALEVVDIMSATNPAKYNVSNQIVNNDSYEPLRPWGIDQVGEVWWDTSNRGYLPYSDVSIYPVMDDRLSRWGSLADWASIDVYEWISSPVPPSQWLDFIKSQAADQTIPSNQRASGSPALPQTFLRQRLWQQRTTAWKYSEFPPGGYNFISGTGQQRIALTDTGLGEQSVILNAGRFSQYDIESDMLIAAYDNAANKPYGRAILAGDPYFVIGAEDSAEWYVMQFESVDQNNFDLTISIEPSASGKLGTCIGPILLSNYVSGSDTYVQATALLTGITQSLLAVSAEANQSIQFDFDVIGIKLSCNSLVAVTGDQVAANFGDSSYDIYIREAMSMNVKIQFPPMDYSNPGYSNDPDDMLDFGFAVWKEPTPDELAKDLAAPNNRWLPIVGDWQSVDVSPQLIERITAYELAPLFYQNGSRHEKFTFTWGPWKKIQGERITSVIKDTLQYHEISFTNADASTIYSSANLQKSVRVYKDGILQRSNNYVIYSSNIVKVGYSGPLNIGADLTVTLDRYIPSSTELAFNPDITDDIRIASQYKIDFEYTKKINRDDSGNQLMPTYYFWLRDKVFVSATKQMSIKNASELLTINTDPYLILQNIRDEKPLYKEVPSEYPIGYDMAAYDFNGYDSDGVDLVFTRMVPRRYATAAIYGLTRQVSRDDTYKLRFTKNFTLRENPNGIDLKNVHTEWELMRVTQESKINSTLWSDLTDAACGQDAALNLIPSLNRLDYDKSNGTLLRFGFGADQAIVDKELALKTIKFTILNTSLRTQRDGVEVPDEITVLKPVGTTDPNDPNYPTNHFDFKYWLLSSDNWFISPESTRYVLTKVWNEAKATQINEIFFAVLNDALSNNYEFTDIFKTSMLSAYSIRIAQSSNIY